MWAGDWTGERLTDQYTITTSYDTCLLAFRPFATDMAGFAINLSYLLSHTSAKFASSVKIGYLESEFLKHLVHLEDLEPLGGEEVLVWHTRTEAVNLNKEKEFTKKHGHGSDQGLIV